MDGRGRDYMMMIEGWCERRVHSDTFAIELGRSGAVADSQRHVTRTLALLCAVSRASMLSAYRLLSPYRASRLGNLDAPLLNGLSTRRMPNANGWPGLVLVDGGSRRRGEQIAGHPVTAVAPCKPRCRVSWSEGIRDSQTRPLLEVGLEPKPSARLQRGEAKSVEDALGGFAHSRAQQGYAR